MGSLDTSLGLHAEFSMSMRKHASSQDQTGHPSRPSTSVGVVHSLTLSEAMGMKPFQ